MIKIPCAEHNIFFGTGVRIDSMFIRAIVFIEGSLTWKPAFRTTNGLKWRWKQKFRHYETIHLYSWLFSFRRFVRYWHWVARLLSSPHCVHFQSRLRYGQHGGACPSIHWTNIPLLIVGQSSEVRLLTVKWTKSYKSFTHETKECSLLQPLRNLVFFVGVPYNSNF